MTWQAAPEIKLKPSYIYHQLQRIESNSVSFIKHQITTNVISRPFKDTVQCKPIRIQWILILQGWSLSQRGLGERQGITETNSHACSRSILICTNGPNLHVLDGGRKLRTQREPTHTRGEHANSTQKEPVGILPGTLCCEMVLTTTPPCSPSADQYTQMLWEHLTLNSFLTDYTQGNLARAIISLIAKPWVSSHRRPGHLQSPHSDLQF